MLKIILEAIGIIGLLLLISFILSIIMGTIFFYGNKDEYEKYFPEKDYDAEYFPELEEINEETDEDDE